MPWSARLCGGRRAFIRAPLMVIAGAGGSGKSTLCYRLAGSIDDVVVVDADVFAEDLVSVVSPNRDYPSFWRSLMQFAHEISQNGVVVAYFGRDAAGAGPGEPVRNVLLQRRALPRLGL